MPIRLVDVTTNSPKTTRIDQHLSSTLGEIDGGEWPTWRFGLINPAVPPPVWTWGWSSKLRTEFMVSHWTLLLISKQPYAPAEYATTSIYVKVDEIICCESDPGHISLTHNIYRTLNLILTKLQTSSSFDALTSELHFRYVVRNLRAANYWWLVRMPCMDRRVKWIIIMCSSCSFTEN